MSFLLAIAHNFFPEIFSGIAFMTLQFIFPLLGYFTSLFENIVLSLLAEIFLSLYRVRLKDRDRLKYLQKINYKIDDLDQLVEKEFFLKRQDLTPFLRTIQSS